MSPRRNSSVFKGANRVAAPLLIAPLCLALTGCLGGGGTSSKSPSSAATAPVVTPPTVITPTPTPTPDPTPAPAVDPTTQYHLTFDDEFNSRVMGRWLTADFSDMRNNPLDYQAQWFADPDYVPAGDPRVAYNPFQFANGILKIIAQPTPPNTYATDYFFPYVSGQLTSAHRFTQRYGYYELRAKLPPGKGLWPRFWLLRDDSVWPGEYDIFEVLGKETSQVHQTTHYPDAQGKDVADGFTYRGINPVDGQFHTYGFLWEKTGVTWYVDGVETLKQINRVTIPMYVLIDMAVGNDSGNLWPGNPDSSTHWPATMEVDYFRAYSNDPSLPSVTPDAGYQPSALPNKFAVVTTPTVGPLPTGWIRTEIGTPDIKGSTTWNPDTGEWILKGAGTGNQSQFAGTTLTADGTVTATVQSLTRISWNDDRGGVAMRTGTGPSDPEISLVYTTTFYPTRKRTRVALVSRGGSATTDLASIDVTGTPITLRLRRSGNLFTGSYSTDGGVTWLPVGSTQATNMTGPVKAGLLVSGGQDGYHKWSRGIFTGVSVVAN